MVTFRLHMKAHWPISILSTLSSLVSMALPLILVRTLDPSTLGAFKIFFLYLMVLPPLTFIAGVSSGLSYWAGRGEEGRKAIRVSAILFLILSLLTLVLMLVCKIPLSHALQVDQAWVSLFAYALFIGIASMFYDDAAIATGRIWTGAIFNSGFELLRTGVIVITAVMTHDLFAIIRAHIAVQSVKMVLGYILAYRQDLFRFEWDPAIFKSVLKYAFPVSLAFVFGLWLNYSDQIILSKTISSAEFALYTVCCLTVPPLMVLEASVTRVLIPQLSEAFASDRKSRASELYKKAVNELGFLVVPAVVGMLLFAAPIIELLFTKTYLPGTHYLRLYSLWYLTLMIPQDAVARARGQARWILINFICFSVLTIGLCFALGVYFGAMGVLSGLLIARFSSRIYTLYYMKGVLITRVSEFVPFANLAKMIAICAGLSAVCLILRPVFHSSLTWFFVSGSGFGISYLILAFPLILNPNLGKPGGTKKVLMLTPGLFIGGLERMILNLSKSLKHSSHWQPQVLAYDFAPVPSLGHDLVSSFESSQIPVISKAKPPRFSLKTVAHIVEHASRDGITVIHTHDLGALIYGALAKLFLFKRVRLVHTQHSFVHLNRSFKYRYYEKFFTRFADAIAVVSSDTHKSYLELGVPEDRLHIIPNGVDFTTEPDTDRSARISRRENLLKGLDPESRLNGMKTDFWILYLARIHGRKGQDHALQLWAQMSPAFRAKSALIFVGPETESGAIEKLGNVIVNAPDRDRVVLAGASQSPKEWTQCSDLFLSSSEFEGMPLAPVEALGSGVPGVLSEIPGHEFLGAYATLYRLDDPKEGALAVEKMVNRTLEDDVNFRNEVWNQSEPIRKLFTLTAMSKQYEKLYELQK